MGGMKRLFKSSKGMAAMIALQTVIMVQFLGLDPEIAKTISFSVVTIMGLYIAGVAYEDGKKGREVSHSIWEERGTADENKDKSKSNPPPSPSL